MLNPTRNPFLVSYATALATGLFAIVAVTGILMFFHIGPGAMRGLHEWLGLGFVVAGILHVLRNGKAFLHLLTLLRTRIVLGVAMLLTVGVLVFSPSGQGGGTGRLFRGAETVSLYQLGPLLGTTGSDLAARLGKQGIAADPGQSLTEIAQRGRRPARALLKSLLTDEG